MSRFADCDGDGDFNPWAGWYARAMSGRGTPAMFEAFLAHLDAMPVKSIAVGSIIDTKTGAACAVGEFARMRGVSDEMLAVYDSHVDEVDSCSAWTSGPTIALGRKVGLPMTIAGMLGYLNDTLDGRYVRGSGFVLYTPEERWKRLRAHVCDLLEQSRQAVQRSEARRERRKRELRLKDGSAR